MENCKASKAYVSKLYEVNKKIKSQKSLGFTLQYRYVDALTDRHGFNKNNNNNKIKT